MAGLPQIIDHPCYDQETARLVMPNQPHQHDRISGERHRIPVWRLHTEKVLQTIEPLQTALHWPLANVDEESGEQCSDTYGHEPVPGSHPAHRFDQRAKQNRADHHARVLPD